jgi:hypothetical protein
LFNKGIQFDGAMRQGTMVADSRTQATGAHRQECAEKYGPPGKGEKYEAYESQNMDRDDENQKLNVFSIRFPPRQRPRVLFT